MPDHSFLSHSCFCKYVFLFCFAFIEIFFQSILQGGGDFFLLVLQLISISEQKFGFGSGGVSSFSVLPIRRRCEPMPHSLLVRGFKLCRDAVIVGAGTLSRTGKSQKKPWQGWKIQSCFELVQMSLTWKDALAYSVNCFCSNFINSTANLKCQLDVSRILYWKFTADF